MRRRADSTTSDAELVAGCLRSEQAAWDGLIDRYAPLMYSIPLKYGLHEADAADVFQAVCLILLQKLDSVHTPGGLAAWIITATTRECLALVRKRHREQARNLSDGAHAALVELTDPAQLPEEELLMLERQHIVRIAVSELPANCRRLVQALFAVPGAASADSPSYQQVAERLGIPTNSLGPTRARCLENLRRRLAAAGYTP